jgi:hypothetical protein
VVRQQAFFLISFFFLLTSAPLDKQMQARLMAMAAGAQLLLGVAYTDSLWLVKNKLAEEEIYLQRKEGFKAEELMDVSWMDFMAWYDYALTGAVWGAPFLLLLATRYSTSRQVHSLTLHPGNMTELVTYGMFGFQRKKMLPNAAIMRTKHANRVYIDGKVFMLHEKGKMFEPTIFSRIYKLKD